MWWFQSVYNISVFYSGWMERRKTECLSIRWCDDFGYMGFQEESKMNPQALTGEGWASDEDIEHSHPAGQDTAESQPRETLERETHPGAQPCAELQDLTVVCSEGDLSLRKSHGVACLLWKGCSILLFTTSFQNTDIRKNVVVTFRHDFYWAAPSSRRASARVQWLL